MDLQHFSPFTSIYTTKLICMFALQQADDNFKLFGRLAQVCKGFHKLLSPDKDADPNSIFRHTIFNNSTFIKAVEQKAYSIVLRILKVNNKLELQVEKKPLLLSNSDDVIKHKALIKDERFNLIDPSAMFNEAVRGASKNGHLEVVKVLLEHPKVDPSAMVNEAIKKASKMGHIEVVKVLLEHPKVDPSAMDNEAYKLACQNGYKDILNKRT